MFGKNLLILSMLMLSISIEAAPVSYVFSGLVSKATTFDENGYGTSGFSNFQTGYAFNGSFTVDVESIRRSTLNGPTSMKHFGLFTEFTISIETDTGSYIYRPPLDFTDAMPYWGETHARVWNEERHNGASYGLTAHNYPTLRDGEMVPSVAIAEESYIGELYPHNLSFSIWGGDLHTLLSGTDADVDLEQAAMLAESVGFSMRFTDPNIPSWRPFGSSETMVGNLNGDVTSLTKVSPVPVPAAAWLFGSALIGLAGIKRKK